MSEPLGAEAEKKTSENGTTTPEPHTETEASALSEDPSPVIAADDSTGALVRDAEIVTIESESQGESTMPASATSGEDEVQSTEAPKGSPLRFATIATIAILILVVLGITFLGKHPLITQYADRANEVVALVNGERILKKEFDQQLAFLMQAAVAQQRDTSDPQFLAVVRSQALDLLVNAKILVQAAEAKGLSADPAKVEEQYALISAQYGTPEEFLKQVETLGFTLEKVRENITHELLITAYIESVIPASVSAVTDAEIKAYYDTESATRAEVPPFEVVKQQIADFLKQNKEQQEMARILEELRNEATIEILLEEA